MKPECNEYQKKIARSLLEDLTAEEKQSLNQHLAECPHCRSEQESFARTLQIMHSAGNEPVPHHFFIHPEEQKFSLWEIFHLLKPRWQVMTVALAGLFFLVGAGLVLSLTRKDLDVGALRKDFLKAAEEQNNQARAAWLQEVYAEITRSRTDLTQQQKAELTAAMNRLDTRWTGRLNAAESRVKSDTRDMAVNLYRTVAQDRAQDLRFINLRFDSIETNNAIETRQTDAMIGTLLQAAELRLK
jgi:type V secretory pathway adhesin AidA